LKGKEKTGQVSVTPITLIYHSNLRLQLPVFLLKNEYVTNRLHLAISSWQLASLNRDLRCVWRKSTANCHKLIALNRIPGIYHRHLKNSIGQRKLTSNWLLPFESE